MSRHAHACACARELVQGYGAFNAEREKEGIEASFFRVRAYSEEVAERRGHSSAHSSGVAGANAVATSSSGDSEGGVGRGGCVFRAMLPPEPVPLPVKVRFKVKRCACAMPSFCKIKRDRSLIRSIQTVWCEILKHWCEVQGTVARFEAVVRGFVRGFGARVRGFHNCVYEGSIIVFQRILHRKARIYETKNEYKNRMRRDAEGLSCVFWLVPLFSLMSNTR